MIRFNNDYNRGAHPEIMRLLAETNSESYGGYGIDEWCDRAREVIKARLGGRDADIHFMVGGTQVNYTVITAALRPYQSVISAVNGHINNHEAGSIEHTGHKVIALPGVDGKLTAEAIERAAADYYASGEPEYLTQPKMVFLSSPSEYGTVYTKEELLAMRGVCDKYNMYLYVDGARLGYWLASEGCDVSLADLAEMADVFYIGGTKCGAMLGEALVIMNPELRDHFRTYMKQSGGILAKGWLIGLQFYALFSDGLYFRIAEKADGQAMRIKSAFKSAGLELFTENHTNQQFVILNDKQAEALAEKYIFEFDHRTDAEHVCVRFCTSWSTPDSDVDSLLEDIGKIAVIK